MAYVVKEKINGKEYYYLVHNMRFGGAWKKKKKYLGKEIPSQTELERMKKELLNSSPLTKEDLPKISFLYEDQKKNLTNYRIDEVKFKPTGQIVNDENEIDVLINFTFNSNAIEGSTMNEDDVKMIFNENIAPAGKHIREIYEAKNTEQTYKFIKNYERDLNKNFILEIHRRLMYAVIENAGEYRKYPVEIPGSNFQPPSPDNLAYEMDRFISFYNFAKKKFHPLETAALVHVKFAELHPFSDGNGRVSRLIMNFVLMKNGYPPVIIQNEDKLTYYEKLEATHTEKDYKGFIQYLYELIMSKYEK